jgi:recombination protein RecT
MADEAKTQVATRAPSKAGTLRSFFTQPVVMEQLKMALPKHLTPDRLLRVAMTSIQQNPRLLDCTQESLLKSVIICAQLGLEPDGIIGGAYLVPYFNTKKNTYEAQFQIG